jgi:hypothetical protein
MTTPCTKYQLGDRVGLAVIDFDHDFGPYTGEYRPGIVNSVTDTGYCPTCHCQPSNPDHHGDGSACCPGPFYEVLAREPWLDEDDENARLVKAHVPEHDLIPGGRPLHPISAQPVQE